MKFKGQIDFKQFIRPSNNYCHYGFAQMFWLELVMNLLGYNSYRSKIARLKELKEFNQLESFYKNIGIDFHKAKNQYPTLATWCEYKVGIDYHSPYLNELYVLLTHFKSSSYENIQDLVHIAVDGKDIRHSNKMNNKLNNKLNNHDNVKSIHFIFDKQLIHSDFTQHENKWIKQSLFQALEQLKKNYS